MAEQAAAKSRIELASVTLFDAQADAARLAADIHATWRRVLEAIGPQIEQAERRAEVDLRAAAREVARAARDLNGIRGVLNGFEQVYRTPKIVDPSDPTLNLADERSFEAENPADAFEPVREIRMAVEGVPRPQERR